MIKFDMQQNYKSLVGRSVLHLLYSLFSWLFGRFNFPTKIYTKLGNLLTMYSTLLFWTHRSQITLCRNKTFRRMERMGMACSLCAIVCVHLNSFILQNRHIKQMRDFELQILKILRKIPFVVVNCSAAWTRFEYNN